MMQHVDVKRVHGGNIWELERTLGVTRERMLDFSIDVNPLGSPPGVRSILEQTIDEIQHYPDPDAQVLREAIASHHRISTESVLPGNGSAELIALLAAFQPLTKALVAVPTFTEYEWALARRGVEVVCVCADEANAFHYDWDASVWRGRLDGVQMVFVCNPNNPIGVAISKERVLWLADRCRENGALLVVDEAYVDFTAQPEAVSVASEAAALDNVIVLRSLTKWFAVPGLRLGYLVAHPELVGRLREWQSPWPLNSFALAVGPSLLADAAFTERSRVTMTGLRHAFYRQLQSVPNLQPFPSSANFFLCRLTACSMNAADLWRAMAKRGMLIRNCDDFTGLEPGRFIRLAVRNAEENEQLVMALREVLSDAGKSAFPLLPRPRWAESQAVLGARRQTMPEERIGDAAQRRAAPGIGPAQRVAAARPSNGVAPSRRTPAGTPSSSRLVARSGTHATRFARGGGRHSKALMIQGTGSSVGKSLLVAALCRIFTQDGYRVRPFKAQNMSNNAAVTADGGEIGRAQAEQAMACRAEPSVQMNPILLKPCSDIGSQVVLLGRAIGTMSAQEYRAKKPQLLPVVTDALRALMEEAEIVVIEGAGSPAEINLKADDCVNMWVARQAGAAVLLVGDIDRGGVFAQLVGTMELLDGEERGFVRGFLINKFRGDFSLLEPGVRWLEARCGRPVLGTIPYLTDIELAEEDAAPLEQQGVGGNGNGHGRLRIEVARLPRISNFTDFDALGREPDVQLTFVDRPSSGPLPDVVMLPGTKSTIADLGMVRERGFDRYLRACVEAGRELVGICGGFQMLGETIRDPDRVESPEGVAQGLGFLSLTTVFHGEKLVAQVKGVHVESGLPIGGYEIHMGRMEPRPDGDAVVRISERSGVATDALDGLRARGRCVWGTHVHGLFDAPEFRAWWLDRLRDRRKLLAPSRWTGAGAQALAGDRYDRLAAAVRQHLDMRRVYELVGIDHD